jgi:hypothetical protein
MGGGKNTVAPQLPPHQHQDITEGRCRLVLPGRVPVPVWGMPVRSQSQGRAAARHQALAPEEERSGALDGSMARWPAPTTAVGVRGLNGHGFPQR